MVSGFSILKDCINRKYWHNFTHYSLFKQRHRTTERVFFFLTRSLNRVYIYSLWHVRSGFPNSGWSFLFIYFLAPWVENRQGKMIKPIIENFKLLHKPKFNYFKKSSSANNQFWWGEFVLQSIGSSEIYDLNFNCLIFSLIL